MKRIILMLALVPLLAIGCRTGKQQTADAGTVNLIMETDIGNDVDDALAMDLIYKYMDEGKVNLLGVCINKEGSAPGEFVDILNTWYGHPEVPIGIIREGADCETDAINYAKAVVDMKDKDGNPAFARTLKNYDNLLEAPELYRKVLSEAADNSVVIASVGFSTNLNLHEYNVAKDIPAAKTIFQEWPTPVVTSPFEVGCQIKYPATSIENDFDWAGLHPVVEAYKAYLPMPYDRETWDPTAVLYAVEGDKWFTVSEPGRITVSDVGSTFFTPDEKGDRRFLSVDEAQAAAVKAHFIERITTPPACRK